MITDIEIGDHFITYYFDSHKNMTDIARKLYKFLPRVEFPYMDLQRRNFSHQPGDVPIFHNGIQATKGPHIHVIYPNRPSSQDIVDMDEYIQHRLVGAEFKND